MTLKALYKKISLIVATGTVTLVAGLSLASPAYAVVTPVPDPDHGTPAPTPTAPTGGTTYNPANDLCEGDASTCVCPSGSNDPTCGTDPVFKNCKSIGSDKSYKQCELSNNLIYRYLNPFIIFLSAIVAVAVVTGIIWGGIQYAASGGDPQKVAKGKLHIRNSIIALLVYLFLFAIINFLVPGTNFITG